MVTADLIRFVDSGKVLLGLDKLNWIADQLAAEVEWFMIEHANGSFSVRVDEAQNAAAWRVISMLKKEHDLKVIFWGAEG